MAHLIRVSVYCTRPRRDTMITRWLHSHDMINRSALARRVGVSPATMCHYVNTGDIPYERWSLFEDVLAEYGYSYDLMLANTADFAPKGTK